MADEFFFCFCRSCIYFRRERLVPPSACRPAAFTGVYGHAPVVNGGGTSWKGSLCCSDILGIEFPLKEGVPIVKLDLGHVHWPAAAKVTDRKWKV
jgi:hypothetical protein